jgi:hypothetical protein
MRLTSLASSSSLPDDSTDHPQDCAKGSIGPGGEKRLFDAEIEDEGAMKILSALDTDEVQYLSDENMPLRHFRAEKVSSLGICFISHLLCMWEMT